MSENTKNKTEEKFDIKVTEKAEFPAAIHIAPIKLSELASTLNGLFSTYKDFIGSGFEVLESPGGRILSFSLTFLPGQNSDGIARAFEPIDNAMKADTPIERQMAREQAFRNGRKMKLTKEGEEGIEKFIMRHFKNNWKSKNIQEIPEKDPYGNIVKVYVKITGIDYIACIKEIFGDTIETSDGDHEAAYNIELKRPITGMNVGMFNNGATNVSDWFIEFVQGDVDAMNEFYREAGVFINPNSPSLNIVPR